MRVSHHRGERRVDTRIGSLVKHCVVIGTDSKLVAACCARPVDVSVAVTMYDQDERLPVSHNAILFRERVCDIILL